MAGKTLQESIDAAVNLLPPLGQEVEFNAYKAKLYAADPNNGRDAFAHMIKKEVIAKKLGSNEQGKPVVMLSRKS